MMSEGAAERLDTSVEVERLVGTACGITVEVLTCAERRKVLLVASPTKWGVTVLAEGALHDADTFARVGACVLRALADVVPLVTGEAFRGPMARDGVAATARQ